jgi:hypothetical protein
VPLWEKYDVEVETSVKIKADGKLIAAFTVPGQAKGGSNEEVNDLTIPGAVQTAITESANRAINLASATRNTRRKELGYGD